MTCFNQHLKTLTGCLLFTAGLAASHSLYANEQLQKECGSCHTFEPNDGPANLNELWQQKGPDLSYAGIKYKADWIEKWLQSPTRIRPAGMFYGNHIEPAADHDRIKTETLTDHPVLNKEKAQSYTKALMALKAKQSLVQPGAFKEGKTSLRAGEMLFVKFKGCGGCHQIEPGYGGLSGPEVYTVSNRLQENYLMSYLKDPQQFSPMTYMPTIRLSEKDRLKLVRYFQALAKEEFAQ